MRWVHFQYQCPIVFRMSYREKQFLTREINAPSRKVDGSARICQTDFFTYSMILKSKIHVEN